MRRSSALAGAVTVLAPLLLVSAPGASAAAKGSLTVTTLDRSGKSVGAEVAVYDAATGWFSVVTSNKAVSLPAGTYELATTIGDDAGDDVTVAGHSVTVSGSTRTTFDARQGRAVQVSLSPAPGAGGTTWHAGTAKHSGSTWSTAVHDPASGRVALRSTVTDTHGDTSTTTVYNAYSVG
jgi:hypothetical protein